MKKVMGLRGTNGLLQKSRGDVKYSTGNVVSNVLILCVVSGVRCIAFPLSKSCNV